MYKRISTHVTTSVVLAFLLIGMGPSEFATSQTLQLQDIKVNASQTFYHAKQYSTISTNHIDVSENATPTEPPKTFKPKGEREFTKDKYLALKETKAKGTESRSVTKFPYHRFDISVGRSVKPSDKVMFKWEGESLPGRQVSMYAWNIKHRKWVELDQKIAGEDSFTLSGAVEAEEYVQAKKKISVIVQDQVQASTINKKYDYSFVWMSDTQYYAQDYPAVFKSIIEWIAENKDVMNIKYVFHTGDIVHKGHEEKQWEKANAYMNTLDVAKIPYGVLPGNHDEGHHFAQYGQYFGEERFRKKYYYGDSYQNNRGHYDLITANGQDYVFVYMGGKVKDKEIEWINKVLERHADRTAILAFHEYLQKNGSKSNIGQEIFDKIVVPNPNVVAVLCGHYYNSELLVDEIDYNMDGIVDRKVYQMIADYQKAPEGGSGYIRLLHIDAETNSIDIQTYSPYLDKYHYYSPDEYPGKDEFTLDIDMEKSEKMVATKRFEVNVYKRSSTDKVAFSKE